MLKHRVFVGTAAQILQKQDLLFKRITILAPSLIVVREGSKDFTGAQGRIAVFAGGAIALAGGQQCDVNNHLGRSGVYRATVLSWDTSLLHDMAAKINAAPMRSAARLDRLPLGCLDAIDAAVAGIADPRGVPVAVAQHRMQEVLLWLAEMNVAFAVQSSQSLGARLMQRVAMQPNEDWSVAYAAAQLGFSETTLRRRLAEEGTGLRDVVTETRMNAALTLLQTSDTSIAQIAIDLGYISASRFTARFRGRFGFAPSQVRGQRIASQA